MPEDNKTFATPKVRKFARELGANIKQIQGTERKGRITQDDVKNFVNNQLSGSKKSNTFESNHPTNPTKLYWIHFF